MLEAFLDQLGRIDPFQTRFHRTLLRRHLYTSFQVPPDIDITVDFGPRGRHWVYERTKAGRGVHEPGLIKSLIALRRVLGPMRGRALYDAGALYGYVGIVGSAILEPAETLMFEMNPDSAAIAQDNAALNTAHRIEVVHAGLTNRSDPAVPCLYREFTLKVRPGDEEIAELREEGFRMAKIDLRTLDEIAASRGVPPGLIKIDVEGSQMSIVEGAKATLTAARPVLLIESDLPNAANRDGFTMAELAGMLMAEFGYRIVVFDHRSWATDPRVVTRKSIQKFNLERNQLMVCLPGA